MKQNCDRVGRQWACHTARIPGLRRAHSYLHDCHVWYRRWHHHRYRPHVHWTALAIAILTASLSVALSFQGAWAGAGILKQFPFQGRLTNSNGTVVADSSYSVAFKLYTVASAGSASWTETDTVTTTNGIFNVMLGAVTSLGTIDFNTDTWYLGVTVGADTEMTPRIRLGAAPYALNTGLVVGWDPSNGKSGGMTLVGGTAASENLTLQSTANATKGKLLFGSSAYDEVNNRLGVGTSSPGATLELKPSIAAALQISPYGTGAGNTGELRWLELAANGTTYVGLKAPDSLAANVTFTLPNADGSANQVLQTNGSGVLSWATNGTSAVNNATADGRLTLTSGTPVTTSDVTGATTLYYTPFNGNAIAIYDGANWQLRTFSEISLALGTLTNAKNYDVFAYWTGSAVALELSAAWTDDTTRADAVAWLNGVQVKSSNNTRRLVGTFRTTATTTTEDSQAKRFLWNAANRVQKRLYRNETVASWTYTTATWRQANANPANQVEVVVGDTVSYVALRLISYNTQTGNYARAIGIGEASTTTPDNASLVGRYKDGAFIGGDASVTYEKTARLGYTNYTWLEYSSASGTTTWYGNTGGVGDGIIGIIGSVYC